MSIIFEGVEMPTACCFVDKEQIKHCKFYNICEKRDTIKTNCKPNDCPVKALEQDPVLDKIRYEIARTRETEDGFLMHDGTKRAVLHIIDKYKESEDKE